MFDIALSNDDIDQRRDVQLFKAIDVLRGTNVTPVETPGASTPASGTPASDTTPTASTTPAPAPTAGG